MLNCSYKTIYINNNIKYYCGDKILGTYSDVQSHTRRQWGNLNQLFGGEYGKTDKIVYYEHFALINYNGHCYLGCDDGCEITDNHSKENPGYFHLVFEIGNQFGTPRLIRAKSRNTSPTLKILIHLMSRTMMTRTI